MARVLGLEAVRMADTDVLPYDYVAYAHAINVYIESVKKKAAGNGLGSLDFASAEAAVAHLAAAAQHARDLQMAADGDLAGLNRTLRSVEAALLTDAGLPNRPWYKHEIYAPGEYTGYAAVVIPGVSEAVEAKNASLANQQLQVLAQALNRAAQVLESAR
jgi:N-acetylated-alpha-linked acidic dipeptidase